MDQRGCGRSADPGPGYQYQIDDLAGDAVALLDVLGIDRISLIGESSGGVISAWIAAHYPHRVSTLILVSTPLRLKGHNNEVKSAGYSGAQQAIAALGMKEYWLQSRGRGGQLTGDRSRDEYFASLFAMTPPHIGQAFWELINASGVDIEPLLPKIAARTLLLSPGASFGTTEADQQKIVDLVPNAKRIRFPDLTHEMYYVAPDRLAPEVAAFLDSRVTDPSMSVSEHGSSLAAPRSEDHDS
ncbi:MAG: alpha/beta hydrolase [Acidimicrobiia bacterium]|nr:alpha/beta hydrolase [Acidimicrobiia bacterium]